MENDNQKGRKEKDEKYLKLFGMLVINIFHTILSLFLLCLILSVFAKISIN
jgi:hypothetical protein